MFQPNSDWLEKHILAGVLTKAPTNIPVAIFSGAILGEVTFICVTWICSFDNDLSTIHYSKKTLEAIFTRIDNARFCFNNTYTTITRDNLQISESVEFS